MNSSRPGREVPVSVPSEEKWTECLGAYNSLCVGSDYCLAQEVGIDLYL